MKFNLTRIAPTPSGYLHLGNAFSFLLTKALAERHGAQILLRIDDLDRERYRPEYVKDIFDTLDFLEIPIHMGPKNLQEFESEWSQIHRMDIYAEALEKIRTSGKVFACDFSRKKIQQMSPQGYYLGQCLDRRIPLDRKETAWRIDTLDSDFIEFKEYPDRKISGLIPEDAAFYMIRKKDGIPSYHLSSLVDDLHFGVDLVVRGKDLLSSTFAQLDLARLLGDSSFSTTTFHHHDLLNGPDKKKLSKSADSTSLQFLRKEGKTLQDIFLLLGQWAGKKEPIHSFEEFSSAFLPQ
ncbi:glutamate--tRNA ligase family protein [Algoriphagus taiwanensis]|uniref:tRNA glutamyl-Q(34) synthetase GluQRS n=1 Tax=Algoriphagus taiwanensis TaxID=1445656 RepID=A0ABQ6Q6D3_9BACT|nr:tRNA glutamyl-Q(34) synthetase GluQRS [Algoriphagus taiwanensis]